MDLQSVEFLKLGIADAIDNYDKKAFTLSELTEEFSIKPSKSSFLPRLMHQSVNYDWFQNDDTITFQTAHEKNYWDYIAEMPNIAKILKMPWLITQFSTHPSLMLDVGFSTVFDLPHVVANLESTENLEFVGGDMFEKLPPTNAILLKWILHDWNDEDCVKILKNCKKAIQEKGNGGKVIIGDTIVYSQKKKKNEKELVDLQISMGIAMLINFTNILYCIALLA
ncbi:hypothetical protein M9H77_37031 [Catharanthus roseus]|uniref:Uncharacterized protein n=1 Tax=Catharanthus roseus TaxID=4058 RepID=A0ACB9ZW34_CATRO|nr:hypothetical protein M9H77_37031 [Catharanthus roseus]